mmetsp:Transcript_69702/g.167326  ORF Transcript_69702/g.167326 Transcript_69702/m.167326 type:complete len:149 (+) Transcript_69702:65-511(+)
MEGSPMRRRRYFPLRRKRKQCEIQHSEEPHLEVSVRSDPASHVKKAKCATRSGGCSSSGRGSANGISHEAANREVVEEALSAALQSRDIQPLLQRLRDERGDEGVALLSQGLMLSRERLLSSLQSAKGGAAVTRAEVKEAFRPLREPP